MHHFSHHLVLSKSEINAEKRLFKLRDEMMIDDHELLLGDFYEKSEKIKNSKLYEALNWLPKPAVHHLHLTAAAPVDYLLKLCRYDYVYFNERAGLFKVTKKEMKHDGYLSVNILRKHWSG